MRIVKFFAFLRQIFNLKITELTKTFVSDINLRMCEICACVYVYIKKFLHNLKNFFVNLEHYSSILYKIIKNK